LKGNITERSIMVSEDNERESLYKDTTKMKSTYGRVWYSGEATKNQKCQRNGNGKIGRPR